MDDKVECGSGILKEPSREFDFCGFVFSGLGSIPRCGSFIEMGDYYQFMGRKTLKKANAKKALRDMEREGYLEHGKHGIFIKKPLPCSDSVI